MPLDIKYPPEFERLWRIYPKWPVGRSKKALAAKAFENARRLLKLDEADLKAIEADIDKRKRDCETWQERGKFGPVAMAVYFNQRLWNEPYEKVRRRATHAPRETYFEDNAPRANPESVRQALAEAKRALH